jgi:hypothetical protein
LPFVILNAASQGQLVGTVYVRVFGEDRLQFMNIGCYCGGFFIRLLRAVEEEVFFMSSQLELFSADSVRNFEIPDLLFNLDETEIIESGKNRDDCRTDQKTDRYFFLKRHILHYHKRIIGRNNKNLPLPAIRIVRTAIER